MFVLTRIARKKRAKVRLFSDMTKFFRRKVQKNLVFLRFAISV